MPDLPKPAAARAALLAGRPAPVGQRLAALELELAASCACQPTPPRIFQIQALTPQHWRLAVGCPICQQQAFGEVVIPPEAPEVPAAPETEL